MKNIPSYDDYLNEQRLFESVSPLYSEVVEKILQTVSQAYILHWQSHTKSEHETIGGFYDEFFEEADVLVETIQGRFNTRVLIKNNALPVENYFSPVLFIENTVSAFKGFKDLFQNEADILSILDNIILLGNKTKYLLSL